MQFGESVGRFYGLMPRNKPSVREPPQASATLMALGMGIVNRGFDPTMSWMGLFSNIQPPSHRKAAKVTLASDHRKVILDIRFG